MTDCKKLTPSKDVCSIVFGCGKQTTTINDLTTCRGETMLIHLGTDGKVIEIELLSNDKPCQQTDRKKKSG